MPSSTRQTRAMVLPSKHSMLIASALVHAIVILGIWRFVEAGSNANDGIGSGNSDGFSATWIPGIGTGTAGGQGDTVVPDGTDGTGLLQTNGVVEMDTEENQSPALDVVQSDPNSVFSSESAELLKSEIESRRTTTVRRESTSGSLVSMSSTSQEFDANSDDRHPSATRDQFSLESDLVTGAAGKDGRGAGQGDGETNGTSGGEKGASGSSGNGSQVEFFGITARGRRVVYVIDASESMTQHNAMELARRKLLSSLKGLSLTSQFQIMFFNLTQHTINQPGERTRLLAATSNNRRLATQFVRGIQPDSGTDRLAAITQALRFEPEIIFLLTDADAPELEARDLWEIQRANKSRAAIHVVEFGIGGDLSRDSFLKKLCVQNRGTHMYHDLLHHKRESR